MTQYRGKSRSGRSQSHHSKRKHSSSTQPRVNPFTGGGRLTLFGRKPVLEALLDPQLTCQKLFVSRSARGEMIEQILRRAQEIALPTERCSALELSRISKHGKQDQGVALDVRAPLHVPLHEALDQLKDQTKEQSQAPIFILDRLNTPANVGMSIRSLWAAGAAGIILPTSGCAPLNPLAVKASAGVALHAAIWRCTTTREALELLRARDIPIFGLAGESMRSLYQTSWPQRAAWVIGNESEGIGAETRALLTDEVSLPMAQGVESLNAAVAASLVAFELQRQRLDTSIEEQ